MTKTDPFSRDLLNRIFAISPSYSDRLTSRENSWLEFKEAFVWLNLGKYIRTAAAFANAKGGYIVYGVANSPHTLIGLKDDRFNKLDPAKLTEYLSDHFDPEVEWECHIHEVDGKEYGLLYFYESRNKPVICRKGADDSKSLKEGEIYYRYKGRTQTIRYAELKELIEERRKHEQLLWFKHLKEIARVGINEAGVFDLRSGKVSGTGGHFFIDESLLSQVSFIREGEFSEKKGKPVIKIIGEARSLSGTPAGTGVNTRIIKTKGIRAADIILAFLRSDKIGEPKNYLTQICYENTAFLPFYYLLKLGKLTLTDATKIIDNEHSTHPAKGKLFERIQDDSSITLKIPASKNVSGQRKMRVREDLLKKNIPTHFEPQYLLDLLMMIRTLQINEIDKHFVKELLETLFNKYYAHGEARVTDEIRRSVCYIDMVINIGSCSK